MLKKLFGKEKRGGSGQATDAYLNQEFHSFSGIYPDYNTALKAVPADRHSGYDHQVCEDMYLARLHSISISDFPALVWLMKLLASGQTLFDLGGNIGVSYSAFSKYLEYPEELRWLVCDVPAVIAFGKQLAQKKPDNRLEFTSDLSKMSGFDILYAAGSIHYLPQTLPELLAETNNPPKQILINTTPFHDSMSFYTLQDIKTTVCPYRVDNIMEFLSAMADLGYQSIDSWKDPTRQLRIDGKSEYDVLNYWGIYLKRG